MILAVMTRVARGHTGRPLEADRVTALIYLMISAAALTRVAAVFGIGSSMLLLGVSAPFWIMSFALFAATYGPMLVSPSRTRLDRRSRKRSPRSDLLPCWRTGRLRIHCRYR